MRYKITAPSHIDTTINLPASKSISNRALILHALGKGSVVPDNLSDCDDTKVIINALKTMPPVIDIKAAGTAMRFMTAYLSVTPGEHVITGTNRMKHRPIRVLVDALRKLGAQIEYTEEEGFPPLRITGDTLDGGMLEIPGDVSSQYISALLMIGPAMKNGLKLRLTGNIVSRPYIDLTLHVMHEFGISVEWTDVDMISVSHQEIGERRYTIENDWSASSYWYEILAMINDDESRVTLPGLKDASRQGDSAVRYLFSMLGVKTAFRTSNEVVLTRHMRSLPRLDYDFINQPDLAQTLVVTCATLGIPFHFTGLGNLRIKETDRIEAMKTEMRKLGYVLDDSVETELSWNGERCEAEKNPVIDTYEDHRMAMAFAPTAILLGEIRINNPEVVTKSYPGYWDDLRKAGFTIEEI
ncbi:3-phosphoshikimate 1-carboxyvinyltransferase [Prevotella lacticifex]|uniref:3-phosphoshikimate 1-carboxyvinyltransferase n=1 Tax=Prevotella lacticifex TaxID=2854755 RepID=A0A9R1CB30_9BACT|nr:3-phosphoshikimate 1-carboxyvinyltransferase [Prevotella lacticifex]GJG36084.1 3-phosphoshikimate 1-carboxyvinyltransferase [Prevotella lacticifex]GJG38866.1 3-phosphoshikimate 1-carboxyvinyltransferase [Prevotella lacticifex]GJG42453.1 3-phosphoshikimate 1-carboxyvinyltransferase [Prevotella lacticifex]GJG45221.1 3-phosphoshikimate 1-carboxyvinyltransferase [Prevotella lacticifex]GJG48804.1 3-phosphoshikimate 1-carboxyvinyltransferase [Prevotella lacticifex]